MRYLICSSLALLTAVCDCRAEEEKILWHPSQDAAWELTFKDNFEDSDLDESNWFPGYRLVLLVYQFGIGDEFERIEIMNWQCKWRLPQSRAIQTSMRSYA